MLGVPIVVSVPKNTKCLSGVDTIISLDAVGAPDIIVALVVVAFAAFESHSKTCALCIKAIILSPKLSIDQRPGSITKSPDAASPHATKSERVCNCCTIRVRCCCCASRSSCHAC